MLMRSYLLVLSMVREWMMSETGFCRNFLLDLLTTLRCVMEAQLYIISSIQALYVSFTWQILVKYAISLRIIKGRLKPFLITIVLFQGSVQLVL